MAPAVAPRQAPNAPCACRILRWARRCRAAQTIRSAAHASVLGGGKAVQRACRTPSSNRWQKCNERSTEATEGEAFALQFPHPTAKSYSSSLSAPLNTGGAKGRCLPCTKPCFINKYTHTLVQINRNLNVRLFLFCRALAEVISHFSTLKNQPL